MGLFGGHNPFKSITKHVATGLFGGSNPFSSISKGLGKILGGVGLGSLFGKKDSDLDVDKPKPVTETPIQTPTQAQIGTPSGKSDVGLGDVMSIFDKDEKDPFKKLLS